MSNNCTCIPMPFAPECCYCYEKLCKYINERDIEIIKIKEKNIKNHKCKCIYFAKNCLYTCVSCDISLKKWINNR